MSLLRLYSLGPNRPTLTIVDGNVDTGYAWTTNGLDLGNAAWEHAFSGPRGTQGARPSVGVPQNRGVVLPIRVTRAASKDQMLQRTSAVEVIADEMRRFGGQILWQSAAQSYRQWFRVLTCGMGQPAWTQRFETNYFFENTLNAVCAPYLEGDPMDTFDDFGMDTLATDWTRNVASSGTLSIAGGMLVPSATGLKVYRHTLKGYALGDAQVTLKVVLGATITNGTWGVIARATSDGLETYAVGEIVAGTNVIRVGYYRAGAGGALSTAAFTPVASTTYWVRLRLEARSWTCEVFTSKPTPVSTPDATVTNEFWPPAIVTGAAGIRVTTADTAERYDDFSVEPYTYRLASMPNRIQLGGAVPGDVPAVADLVVTPQGGDATPIWGLASWLERPLIRNLCWNGDFDDATVGADGWGAGAVAGVIGAGTSATRTTSAGRLKYGAGALQILTPATTDTGASFKVSQPFVRGRLYVAMCWASSAAGTSSRIKLGVNTDISTGTAAALAAIPKVYAVTWSPVLTYESAYVAFGVNAATSTNLGIDGVIVAEVPPVALSAAIASAGAASCTVYDTPIDTPNLNADGTISAPFLALIDLEIVRVTAISGLTWSIDRGAEGSTAATHALDAIVAILPPLRPQFEGKGAAPAFGLVDAASYVPGLSDDGAGSFAITTTSSVDRGSDVLRWAPGTSGPQAASLVYFIDPHTLVPDDYTQGEIDVEVWARQAWTPSLTSPRVTVSALPELGATTGPERFTREFNNIGKLLWPAGAKVSRIHRLGILPLIVDRANPQRWRLKLALACTGGASPTWDIDYLMLVPTRTRTAYPTGKANDTALPTGAQPAFVPYDAAWGGSSAMTKTLRSDGSSMIASLTGYGYQDLGPGKPIEIPAGDSDLIVKVSTRVPDDPTLDSTAETTAQTTTSVHAIVIPRYAIGRGV